MEAQIDRRIACLSHIVCTGNLQTFRQIAARGLNVSLWVIGISQSNYLSFIQVITYTRIIQLLYEKDITTILLMAMSIAFKQNMRGNKNCNTGFMFCTCCLAV